jgi:hypothetical protein
LARGDASEGGSPYALLSEDITQNIPSLLADRPLSHVTVSWKVEPVEGPCGGILVSAEPVTVMLFICEYPIEAAGPATATLLNTQFTAGLFALLVIDTRLVPAPSSLSTSSDGGGGGGSATGGAAGGAATGGAATGGAGSGGGAAGGGGAAVEIHPVVMSDKLDDNGALVRVVPSGAAPGWPAPDTTMPTSAINAAAAMRTPVRWYHGGGGNVRPGPSASWRELLLNTFIEDLPWVEDKAWHWSNRAQVGRSRHRLLRVIAPECRHVKQCACRVQPGHE